MSTGLTRELARAINSGNTKVITRVAGQIFESDKAEREEIRTALIAMAKVAAKENNPPLGVAYRNVASGNKSFEVKHTLFLQGGEIGQKAIKAVWG